VAYVGGTSGNDSLVGTSGADTLEGFAGNDTLVGALGNDLYIVGTGDVLNDSGGVDTVQSTVSWTLAAGFENLTFTGTATTSGSGNNLNNVITGSAGNNWLRGLEGNDTINAGAGNDTIQMSNGSGTSYGSDVINGGDGVDTLDYGSAARTAVFIDLAAGTASGGGTSGAGSATVSNVENANGSAFNDVITGSAAANFLFGFDGNDTLNGGAGNDRLEGGAGSDSYVFTAIGAANADTITGFVSGADKIVLDGLSLGTDGNFTAGDSRFAFNSAQDSNDRIIYNTASGQLWYDADGNGAGTAQLIATLQGAPALAATDIVAQNSTGGGSGTIGTEGNDTLVGTDGVDTIDGLGGNDDIDGLEGADSLIGGSGNDTLFGGDANFYEGAGDTLNGGLGDDRYVLGRYDANVLLADAGGTDTVVANSGWWTLAIGFENLELGFDWTSDGVAFGTGNAANNIITGFQGWWVNNVLDGAGGDDTLIGGDGEDRFTFEAGTGNYGNDFVDGRSGLDILSFANGLSGAVVIDWRVGAAEGGGSGGTGSVTFANIETIEGSPFGDHITGPNGSGWGDYYYGPEVRAGAGNDTLVGGDNYDYFYGEDGDDHLSAGTGGGFLAGGAGNDTLLGGDYYDEIHATLGSDSVNAGALVDYVYLYSDGQDTVDGGADYDYLYLHNYAQSAVVADLAAGTLQGGDASGGGGATILNFEGITTASFDDRISGNSADNYISAGLGNDTLSGRDGNDTLYGGTGETGFPDDDWLDGGLGNDYLWGAAGFDRILFTTTPGAGNIDFVSGFVSGEDELRFDSAVFTALGADGRFGPGDERFYAAAGATSGQDTSDRLIYDTSSYALYYDADGSGSGAAQQIASFSWGTYVQATDMYVGFQIDSSGIRGTSGDDTLTGTAGDDFMEGLAGDDFVQGLGGNDTISGMDGRDGLDGGSGNDSMSGGAGDDSFYMLLSSSSYGNDTIDGGAGRDWVAITGNFPSAALVVDLAAGTMSGGGFATDSAVLVSIEDVSGTRFADRMSGDAFDNGFFGADGNDTLDGAAGNDNLQGGAGNDSLTGGAGSDFFRAEDGNDTQLGGDGNDEFLQSDFGGSSPGADVIDGGAGTDWIRYDVGSVQSGIVVDLGNGTLSGGGASGTGSAALSSIENVTGSALADLIRGDSNANSLNGSGGADTLAGGMGRDTVAGGLGADGFLFDTAPNSTNWDLITDFVSGVDKIQLDANVMSALGTTGNFEAGDGRFFAGNVANSGGDADDRVIYNTATGQLYYDSDGNGAAASQLIATLQGAPAFNATDIEVLNGGAPQPPSGGTFNGTTGNDTLTGGAGNDTISGNAGADLLQGMGGNDSLLGGAGWDTLQGGDGNDWLQPGLWSDTVTGGAGSDSFVWGESGNNTRDSVTDFVSGVDEVLLDNASMTALGANASWAAGDGRFWSAAGATSGHDADDRLVYNTNTGNLYYDADGSGAGAAQVIATFQGGVVITSSDITVI
jgi:Ca2+-binding RTX toxin-like protein